MAHFRAINRWWSALGRLSWHFNELYTLVSLSKHLPLISFLISSSKVRLGVILVHLHLVEASSGTSDRLSCGILVTLGRCHHLDDLEAANDR
jgi:hypothetical protein